MNTEVFLVVACLSPKQLLTDVNFCTETTDNQKYIFVHRLNSFPCQNYFPGFSIASEIQILNGINVKQTRERALCFLQRQGLNSMTKQRTLGFSKAFEIRVLNGVTQYQTN